MAENASRAFHLMTLQPDRTLAYVAIVQMTYPNYWVYIIVVISLLCHEISNLDGRIKRHILSCDHIAAVLLDTPPDNWDPSTRLLERSATSLQCM